MPCAMCGEYYFDEESDGNYCQELDLTICDDCLKQVEEHHKADGKFVVVRCSECHKVKKVRWVAYKKRGHPAGKKNIPKPEKLKQMELSV